MSLYGPESVDGNYHGDMEKAFENLKIIASFYTLIEISGKEPLVDQFCDTSNKVRYRHAKTGRFVSEEGALEILARQAFH